MIDAPKLRNLLAEGTRRPWKQTYAYNNAGMPTADFHIPGHNGGATVEMLACDAELLVEAVHALPELLSVFEAALKFKNCHLADSDSLSDLDQHIALGKLMAARDELLQLVHDVMKKDQA